MLNDFDENKYNDVLDTTPYVFVYGTLMSGGYNNYILTRGMSELYGEHTTKSSYLLLDVGYPYAIPKDSVPKDLRKEFTLPVKGEVWEVYEPETMNYLDRLEGEGHHYHRRLEQVDDNTTVWMYQMDDLEWASRFSKLCPRDADETYYKWREL